MVANKQGAITFGLVYIPVELYAATRPEEISFNQLAKDTMERVKYVKTCPGCKKELKSEDIVRGYQYEKGKYVTVSDEELDAIKTERDKALKIEQFSNPDEISPIYYQKAFRVLAQKDSKKPLELLRRAMIETNKVAVGTSVLSGDIRGTYEAMNQPPLSPPGQVFGIVWPVLYVLMGIALFLIVREPGSREKSTALALFAVQLFLNFIWSIIFFAGGMLWVAFAIVLALDVAVLLCLIRFIPLNKFASWLFAPYLVWILFATYLNIAFALLN